VVLTVMMLDESKRRSLLLREQVSVGLNNEEEEEIMWKREKIARSDWQEVPISLRLPASPNHSSVITLKDLSLQNPVTS
jgi:hypothetical protein